MLLSSMQMRCSTRPQTDTQLQPSPEPILTQIGFTNLGTPDFRSKTT